jgi:hypothetical protein
MKELLENGQHDMLALRPTGNSNWQHQPSYFFINRKRRWQILPYIH